MAAGETVDNGLPYGEILYTEEEVDFVVGNVAVAVDELYRDREPLFISVLDGAIPFTADLMRNVESINDRRRQVGSYVTSFHPLVKYINVSRFGTEQEGGKPFVKQELPEKLKIAGRDVVLVDELVDKYGTLRFLAKTLRDRGAVNVEVVTAAIKQGARRPRTNLMIHRINGLPLPAKWITGYGMDDRTVTPNDEIEGNRFMKRIALGMNAEPLTDAERRWIERGRVKIGLSPKVGGPIVGISTHLEHVLAA